MQQARRVLGVLTGLFALVLIADPVAAQTSVNEELIFGLNRKLLYVAVPITVLVEGILIYTVYRFRDNDDPKPTQENRRLEITWTIATAIILLFVGLASYQVLGSEFIGGATATVDDNGQSGDLMELSYDYPGASPPAADSPDATQIEVKAFKYAWQFNHQNAGGENVSASGTLVIPANEKVYLHVTSKDWLHAVHIPALGLKQDAFPGQYNTIATRVTEEGTYQLYCAEYCGVGHSNMLGEVRVVSQEEYQQYLEENGSSGGSGGNASGNGSGNASGNASASLVTA
ncbi:cytochrome c oxidase subunit II [Halomarina oriensis]|uniref:cytochrome-c oxidase n=1 Tax=Halomarina oriensis TaxID=671145 RepID=A0A6B0GMB7_9EURY|nr:cytochrome c oxidase subunit II transmembrane domain-containing protein [Halomarina oriensis]MWG33275.1 cytochrome c oxidase subunit II [Halomarina oriensis]